MGSYFTNPPRSLLHRIRRFGLRGRGGEEEVKVLRSCESNTEVSSPLVLALAAFSSCPWEEANANDFDVAAVFFLPAI